MQTLGERLRTARNNSGMTMRELAAKTGCTYALISQIETGMNRRSHLVPQFAAVLKVDPLWLSEGYGGQTETLKSRKETKSHQSHRFVDSAIKYGYLPKPSTLLCLDCGSPAQVYDHRDYNRPLDVEPVCHACNVKRGPAVPFVHVNDR